MRRFSAFLKKHKVYLFGFVLWIFAISTPLIFQAVRTNSGAIRYKRAKENVKQFQSFFNKLSNEQKEKMFYLKIGVIKHNENDFYIVGDKQKTEELLNDNKIIVRKIDYEIIDIKKLVLQSAIHEIKTKLNEAENALISDFYGTIITNDNDEFFIVLNKELCKFSIN